jgi:uncharacterized protein (TIGR02996 family)
MSDEMSFLRAMEADPANHHLRLVFADWLEEHGDPRSELIRLTHALTQSVGGEKGTSRFHPLHSPCSDEKSGCDPNPTPAHRVAQTSRIRGPLRAYDV